MLFQCIRAEKQKLRHSLILPACLFIPVIPAVMGTFNYMQNLGILKSQWYSLWTQHTLFYASFFFAPLIGLYCSYIWRLEHRHNNWNRIMTAPVPVSDLFFGKLVWILLITLLTQLWTGILYLISGKLAGLPGIFPPEIIIWILRGTLGAIPICCLQLFLSMKIRSFSIPVGIGLIGSVLGVLFNNEGIGIFWPYSLMLLGMNSNGTNESILKDFLPFLLSVTVFSVFFCLAAIWNLKHRDVKA